MLKWVLEKAGVEGATWIEIAQQMGSVGNYCTLCEKQRERERDT